MARHSRHRHNKKRPDKSQRATLPYGMWQCADGREVLFNRYYQPIKQRMADGTVSVPSPTDTVQWINQQWFYDDATVPSRNSKTRKLCQGILSAWN